MRLISCIACNMTRKAVKNVVLGNSLTKLDQTYTDRKGVEHSEVLNYSVYSRLDNNVICTAFKSFRLCSS